MVPSSKWYLVANDLVAFYVVANIVVANGLVAKSCNPRIRMRPQFSRSYKSINTVITITSEPSKNASE